MEIEIRTENKNKKQRKNKLGSMSFIKCVPKAKKNKRKFTLFCPQMDPKNKTSFVQKRATNNLQLFTIGKHTQNSSVFPLTNKTTKSTKTNYDNPTPPTSALACNSQHTIKTKQNKKNKTTNTTSITTEIVPHFFFTHHINFLRFALYSQIASSAKKSLTGCQDVSS